MENSFGFLTALTMKQVGVTDIVACNEETSRYGLMLTQEQAKELIETRNQALADNGRIEFGVGILNKIISGFCDSPYLIQKDYAETLHALVEAFYYFKNESQDELGDDELILLMKDFYDNTCHGSLELLVGRELEKLAHNIRYGINEYDNLNADDEEPYDEDPYDDEEDCE